MAPTEQQLRTSKTKQLSGGKAPKASIQRYLKSIEPKLIEDGVAKTTLLFKGIRCSSSMAAVLQELRSLQAPHVKLLTKKNYITPFDDAGGGGNNNNNAESIEFLCTKNDASLFAMASTNKKRPNNLIMGRTFDHVILDMVEFGIQYFKSMKDYGGTVPKKRVGSKPMLLFVGDAWQNDVTFRKLQNLLTDFYRGDVVDTLVVSGLDHLIMFAAATPSASASGGGYTGGPSSSFSHIVIHQRTYFCQLSKNKMDGDTVGDDQSTTSSVNGDSGIGFGSGAAAPVPHLTPCGPDFDYIVRRTRWADNDLYKASRKQPTNIGTKPKKIKNQSTNMFGERIGRLHIQKQDIDHMAGRKSKALRRADKISAKEEKDAIEKELQQEQQQEE